MNAAPSTTADDLATPIRVLYAASSPADGEFVRAETSAHSPLISVTCATGAAEAMTCLDAIGPFDAVLVDRDLPDGSAPALISRIRHRNPGVGIVACLKADDAADAAPAIEAGAHEWIPKRRDTIAQLYPVFRRAIDSCRKPSRGAATHETVSSGAASREGFDAAMAMREATLAHEAERSRLEQALADQQAAATQLALELTVLRSANDVARQEFEKSLRAAQDAARAERETMRAVLADREEARASVARELVTHEQQHGVALRELESAVTTRDQEIARLTRELEAARHADAQPLADVAPDRGRRNARTEAGQLIAAVSDDFDAVLAVLDREYQSLCEGSHGQDQRDLTGLGRALREARALTRMLKAFSRRERQRPRVDLHTLVAGLQPMLARVFDEDVQFDIEVGTDAGSVGADPVALELVLMTLVVAVREQMPTGGRVSIATKVTTGADDAANDAGGGVQLMVTARRWRHDIAIPELASDRWLAPSSPGVNLGHLERVLQANGGWIDTSASTADQLAITIGLASA